MGKLNALLMAGLLFGLASAAAAAAAGTSGCTLATSGYSAFFGTKVSGAKFIDHSSLMKQGNVTSISLFFSKSAGCLRGAKVVIDTPTPTPGVVGTSINTSEVSLKLSEGEYVTKAEHKTSKCIQYVKLYTNKGRTAFAGLPDAPATLVKMAPAGKGRLVSLRGFQSMNDTKPGALQQLQFVWGVQDCAGNSSSSVPAGPVSASALRTAAPANATDSKPEASVTPSPAPAPASSSKAGSTSSRTPGSKNSTSSSKSSSTGSSAANAVAAPAPAATAPAAPTKNTDPAKCAAKLDMCNEKASMNQFTYCVWNEPFTKSACKGGCCFSSGKCASSSCTISGMGRDVSNMICYGTNSGYGFGGSNQCAGLACKLATPGCTTDAFGGNCVGTVVAFKPKEEVHPESVKYIGAACLDATPSDTTLDAGGNPVDFDGMYMGKLWTICDCSDSDDQGNVPDLASNLVNLTTTGLSNITKNDVMLAMSQLLPKFNLSDALDSESDADTSTQLFPSFTNFFKLPSLPTITMPEFLGGASSSNGSLPAMQMPSLQSLLEQLSLSNKADTGSSNSSSSGTGDSSAAVPAAAGSSSTGLSGIKNLLSKFLPSIQGMANGGGAAGAASGGAAGAATAVAADDAAAAPAAAAPAATVSAPAAEVAVTAPTAQAAGPLKVVAPVAAPAESKAAVAPAVSPDTAVAAAAASPAAAQPAAPAVAPAASSAPMETKAADGSSSSSSSSGDVEALLGKIGW